MSRLKPQNKRSKPASRKREADPGVLETIRNRRYLAFLRALFGPQVRVAR